MERVLPWFLFIIGAAVFANGLPGPFIYDDAEAILDNPQVRRLWPPAAAAWAPAQTPTAGRPVPALTFAINHAIGGLHPVGYRAVNVGIHLANAVLLFALVRRLLRGPRLRETLGDAAANIAFVGALLWMVHPVVTESVDYITQRTGLLMAFFYLATLYAAVRGREGGPAWSAIAIACCALGMASKESMVTAPLIVVLCDATLGSEPGRWPFRARWRLYAGLMATWFVLIVLNLAGPRSDTVGFDGGVGAFEYLLNQCIVLVHYLRLVVWPHPLALDYGYVRPYVIGDVWPQGVLLVLLGLATIAALLRRPPVGFALACFFIILGPTSSIVPITTEVGAERRMYLPLAALVVLAVVAARALLVRVAPRRLGFAIAMIVAAALVTITFRRNAEYRSEVTIWESAVAAVPDNPRAHNNLGNVLEREGRLDEAIEHHRRSVALRPDVRLRPEDRALGHYNLGRVLQINGETDAAIAEYERAVGEAPHPRALHNLGTLLHAQGRTKEAIAYLRRAVEVDPGSVDSLTNLGFALIGNGRIAEAVPYLERAIELAPNEARVHFNLAGGLRTLGDPARALPHYEAAGRLSRDDPRMQAAVGLALDDLGAYDEAIACLRRAIELAPDDAVANERLGGALVRAGRAEEAIAQLQRTIQRWPGRPLAWTEATRLLAEHPDPRRRNPSEAVRLGERVVRLTGEQDPRALAALAAAYAAGGRMDEAVTTAEHALALAEGAGNAALADRIRAEVERYQHRP